MSSNPRSTGARPETVVGEPAWVRLGSWLLCPLLGGGAGWLLKAAAEWLITLPWLPVPGPLELVASIPEPQGTLGAIAFGVLAGLAFAFIWARERLDVLVSAQAVTLKRDGNSQQVAGERIEAVFRDGKDLVLLGLSGEELAREKSDLDTRSLREAFLAHGHSWRPDGDPYAEEYRLWVEDTPDLPASTNAVLKARGRALHKDNDKEAAVLRAELIKIGIVVRDQDEHQYWRHATQH